MAETRLLDAQALLGASRYDAAYYLAGYVVECALKACIAKRTKRHDFPLRDTKDIYSHDLGKLRKMAGLDDALTRDFQEDPKLEVNWSLAKDWKEDARYQSYGRMKAEKMFAAVSDPQHGVLQCLRKYW